MRVQLPSENATKSYPLVVRPVYCISRPPRRRSARRFAFFGKISYDGNGGFASAFDVGHCVSGSLHLGLTGASGYACVRDMICRKMVLAPSSAAGLAGSGHDKQRGLFLPKSNFSDKPSTNQCDK